MNMKDKLELKNQYFQLMFYFFGGLFPLPPPDGLPV